MQAVVLVRGNYSVRKYRRTPSWCDKRIILEKYAEKTNQINLPGENGTKKMLRSHWWKLQEEILFEKPQQSTEGLKVYIILRHPVRQEI